MTKEKYGFIQYLSQDPHNIVVGLVRDKEAVEKVIRKDGLKNITILQADILDRQALRAAKTQVEKLTGGSLDYLINNAAYVSRVTSGKFLDDFEDDYAALDEDLQTSFNTNVIGVINTINTFLPLIKKGGTKKVITLSTGMVDPDLITGLGVWEGAPYCISKAAVNIAVAKYSARYRDEGVLFLAVSPGVVDNGLDPGTVSSSIIQTTKLTLSSAPGSEGLFQKFSVAAPDFKGPMSPLDSVEQIMNMLDSKSVANGDGGAFISHHGDKNWM